MNTKTLTLAVVAVVTLAVSVGGVAATDHVYSPSDDVSDELPEEQPANDLDAQDGNESSATVSVVDGELVLSLEKLDRTVIDIDVHLADGEETEFNLDVVLGTTLADATFDIVDENDLLSDDEETLLEELLVTDSDVDNYVDVLLDNDELGSADDIEEWTVNVSEYENGLFAPEDELILEAELTTDDTDDAVTVLLNLENQEVLEVIPTVTLDVTSSELNIVEGDENATEAGEEFDFEVEDNDSDS